MDLSKNTNDESKLEKAHNKMRVVFTALGIITFIMGAIVNYYKIKKISK